MTRSAYLLERAWVGGAVLDDVLVEIGDGRFTSVTPGVGNSRLPAEALSQKRGVSPGNRGNPTTQPPHPPPPPPPTRLPGLTLPGLANCHSHAFHRALRGRTQRGTGTFWTWREQMYDVAGRLDPDSYFELARATYREMAAAGITCVGEFHYLHHQPGGTPYDDPNAMGHALVAAARDAGIRIALLDTCYLSSGFGAPVTAAQTRFADADADAWAARVADLADLADLATPGTTVIGAAIHSVRAVPDDQLRAVVEAASGRPLHVHLSEQVAENDACIAAYGATPTQLLADHGALGPDTTAVHATHLTADDVAHLGDTRTHACFCPTTERDLGDGVGPSRALHEAGARLTLGSDSHAVIDLFEEMRAVELDERLARQSRGHWPAADLLAAATGTGHASLGFPDAGAIAVGARADLVTVATDHPSTAGTGADEHTAVYAATAADVVHVVVDGLVVVREGDRADIGRDLHAAIARTTR
ncbi:formimidoylglutamate deiminase [soil metagenome]